MMISKHLMRRMVTSLAFTLPLAACGGGGGGSDSAPQPPVVVETAQEDKFGVGFGTAFRAPMNTAEPVPVNEGDLVPVSLTTEPIEIKP